MARAQGNFDPLPTAQEYLLAQELTVAFNSDADYWLDVAQLERAPTTADSINRLISGLTLYRGELLPGFYDDWAVLEHERMQALFETKMQKLLQILITTPLADCAGMGRTLDCTGLTPEPAYRTLMIAHGAQGNMSQVTLDYERSVERLRQDLGVEPSADTRALYGALIGDGRRVADEVSALTIAATIPPVLIQPSGTVTFLFSDIEGWTKLLETLGSEYANLLADHHDVSRDRREISRA